MDKPKVTHSGNWVIDKDKDISVQCYVMDNEERVLSMRGTARAMGLLGGGGTALIRNVTTKWIAPYLSDNLRDWLSLALRNELPYYKNNNGKDFMPLEASLFIDLCKAYIDALHDNVLETEVQKKVAERLYLIMTAFAKVGLVAIIDEITGYQDERDRDELQKILAKYISEELMSWTKRFPDEFYKQMFRLKGWDYKGKSKPPYAGKLTNEYIYSYLPRGVLDELRVKNPKDPNTGRRKSKHHQWLTESTGQKHLDNQLQQTMALMKAADDWNDFDTLFKKSMGEPIRRLAEEDPNQIQMDF